jgi:lipopolysaccharide transport system permease protein
MTDRRLDPLSRLRESRWLLWQWARRDVQSRFAVSSLGIFWTIGQPVLLLVVYGTVLKSFLHVSSGPTSYVVFAASGLALWGFVSGTMSRAVTCFVDAQSIIGKVYFPREVIPLAAVLVALVDLAVLSVLLLATMVVSGGPWHGTALLGPVVIGGLVLEIAALSVALATLAVFIPDLRQAAPIGIQMLFIATPVMYTPETVPSDYRWVLAVNPIAHSLRDLRACLLYGQSPTAFSLLVPYAVGALGLMLALRYLVSVEQRFPDVL